MILSTPMQLGSHTVFQYYWLVTDRAELGTEEMLSVSSILLARRCCHK
jgi:hypothetical protein